MENEGLSPRETGGEPEKTLEERVNALAEQWSAHLTTRQEALDARESALRSRERSARVREALEKRGLPAALSACLNGQGTEEVEGGVAALEEAFRAAVQQAVDARLTTGAPKAAPFKPLSEMTDEEYYAAVAHS